MLFALGFIAQFTIGGLSGVMHSIVPSDTQQTDTYFVVAHFHYVLFGGLVFAIFGGFYYWFPKIFGKHARREDSGKLNFWLMVIGFNLTFFPMHFLGFEGQPRRTYTYPTGMGWDTLNLLATIGAFIIALSVLVFLVNVDLHAAQGRDVPARTRGTRARSSGSTSSPPPEYNFAEIPVVTHRDEFWHRKYTEDDEGRLVKLPASERCVDAERGVDPHEPHNIHMPSPSYWPLVFALGLPIMGYGFVFKYWWLLGVGVVDRALRTERVEPSTEPATRGGAVTDDADHRDASEHGEPSSRRPPATRHDDQHRRQQRQARRSGCSSSSEALFFGAFISTYFLYRGRDAQYLEGPDADELLNIPFTSVTSFVLLMSSLTMVLALAAIQRGDHRRLRHLAARHRASSGSRSSAGRSTSSPSSTARVCTSAPTCSARRSSCSPACTARTSRSASSGC